MQVVREGAVRNDSTSILSSGKCEGGDYYVNEGGVPLSCIFNVAQDLRRGWPLVGGKVAGVEGRNKLHCHLENQDVLTQSSNCAPLPQNSFLFEGDR